MDEIKAGIQQQKGTQAYELLNSQLLTETFAILEQDYIKTWRLTEAKNTQERERMWTAIRILDSVRHHLIKLVNDGKIASKDLAQIKYLKR